MTRQIEPQLLSTEEAAQYLGMSAETLRHWRKRWEHDHYGPAFLRLGRHVKYRRATVDAWIRALEGAPRDG